MQPHQASQYLNQAKALRKIAVELEPTDATTATRLLEMAAEYVIKADALMTAACESHLKDIGKRAS